MKKRFQKIQNDFEKLLKDKERGIIKNYAIAFKRLEKELREMLKICEVSGEYDFEELFKYNRIKKYDAIILSMMIKLYSDNRKIIRSALNDTAKTTAKSTYNQVRELIELKTIKDINYKGIVNQRVAGRVWTERYNHRGGNISYEVQSIIKAGMERGDTYTTISKDLKKKLDKDISNIQTLVRTEAHRVQESTKYEAMSEINKKIKINKVWHTVSDERVRSSHAEMEGVSVAFEEDFELPGGATAPYPGESGDPAEDINCRCWCSYETN